MINIHKILTQGEGLTIEFKRAKDELPSSLFETVCAFQCNLTYQFGCEPLYS